MASKFFLLHLKILCPTKNFIRHSKKFRHDVQNAFKNLEMASKIFSFASNKKFYKVLKKTLDMMSKMHSKVHEWVHTCMHILTGRVLDTISCFVSASEPVEDL